MAYKEFYFMFEQSKSMENILNYNNCLITLLATASIDLCKVIIYDDCKAVINDFYDRWKIL